MIFKTNRLQKEELPSFCRVKTNLMDNPMISLNQRDSETFDLNFKEKPKILFKTTHSIAETNNKHSNTEFGSEINFEERTSSNYFHDISLSQVNVPEKNVSKRELFVAHKAIQPVNTKEVVVHNKLKSRREEIKLKNKLSSRNSKSWFDNEYTKQYNIRASLQRELISKDNKILELENELELLQSNNSRLVVVSNFVGFRGLCSKCMIPIAILGIIGLIICSIISFPQKLDSTTIDTYTSSDIPEMTESQVPFSTNTDYQTTSNKQPNANSLVDNNSKNANNLGNSTTTNDSITSKSQFLP